ncbi:UNC93-like protein isoform X2 [Drosophila bipectinata]
MIYLPCVLAAIIMVVVFLDPLKRYGEGRKGANKNEISIKSYILATFHQMRQPNQQFLIPLTVYIGLEQAWIAAEYTQAFVSCALGVNMIGFVMISWGVFDSMFCLIFGWIMKYMGRSAIVFIGASVNTMLIGFKLYWRPIPQHPIVFYALAGIWGIGDAVWVTQINGFYGLLFRRHKEAAFSNYRLFESIGFVVGFTYSSFICTRAKLYIMLLLLVIGLVGYLTVEVIYQNRVSALFHSAGVNCDKRWDYWSYGFSELRKLAVAIVIQLLGLQG